MNYKFIKKGIIAVSLATAMLVPSVQTLASDETTVLAMTKQNKEIQLDQNTLLNAVAEISDNTTIEKTIKIESSEEIKMKEMLSGKIFAATSEEGYLLVNSAADENSDWIGKVYETSVVKIVEKAEDWTQIESGNVTGFIKTENLIIGKDAIEKAKEILADAHPNVDLYTLEETAVESSFSVAETRAEEEARLAAEEAKRRAEEEARLAAERAALAAKGESVVSYAKQFLGNPYVWGGTSLTNGTDCSGFVKGVYAHFGIHMPRTSYAMRSVGRAVSYSEILPGDVICYSGHVGIYAGNGQIVNAIDESRGIGMSSATYTNIITIRRLF